MEKLKEMILKGKTRETAEYVRELIDKGAAPGAILKEAMIPAMDEVGDLFGAGEYYVPEMLISAKAMQNGLEILKPILKQGDTELLGTVIVGTVKGDLHDIGKNLVVIALEGVGFKVIDLGTDVSPEKFIEAIREHKPAVVGLSALLTTTMRAMKVAIQSIEKAGLRDKVKIMVGGAPVNKEFSEQIGADFYALDSTAGRNYAREAVTGEA